MQTIRVAGWAFIVVVLSSCGSGVSHGRKGTGAGGAGGASSSTGGAGGAPAVNFGGGGAGVGTAVCGNSVVEARENCDDGNTKAGDGCSDTCRLEPGYSCPTPGKPCELVEWCGDGKLSVALGEECDDGGTQGGDGCSAQCKLEANYVCPVPGKPCVSTVKCGDHVVSGSETCDDGNLKSGDGCDANCQLEPGWACPPGGVCRPAKCGDGIIAGSEQCDDGNSKSGDGCSSTCQIESPGPTQKDGWMCPTAGKPCVRTNCGNGVQEGSEQCDDGNHDMGDGCSPFCRKEPSCPATGGACTSVCGDGLLLPVDKANGQECDDGNNISGDGCSADCKIEAGYSCVNTPIVQGTRMILPIVLRDFKAASETYGHPDFEAYTSRTGEAGIVLPALGTTRGGKPVHVSADMQTTTNNNPGVTTDYFGMWYVDVPTTVSTAPANIPILQTLTLSQLTSGVYQYASGAGFFPIDGMGWGNYASTGHNFHFTSEVRYWFQYAGSEKFDFTGDDDLWVFINKRLAVDLGGVHPALNGNTTLDPSNGTTHTCDLVTGCGRASTGRTVDLGLKIGSVYEIVVFQAERHTVESNYTLTLSGFSATRSTCTSICGDGIVTADEACDLGKANNTGAYGTCNADCTLAPYCGDAIVNGAEQCDSGLNLATYGGAKKVCGPGCKWASYCGDGIVDSSNGEQCDDGKNDGSYNTCSPGCVLGPRCGDGIINDGAEQCDDGPLNGTANSNCLGNCTQASVIH